MGARYGCPGCIAVVTKIAGVLINGKGLAIIVIVGAGLNPEYIHSGQDLVTVRSVTVKHLVTGLNLLDDRNRDVIELQGRRVIGHDGVRSYRHCGRYEQGKGKSQNDKRDH